jgi:periplasmic protein TonB
MGAFNFCGMRVLLLACASALACARAGVSADDPGLPADVFVESQVDKPVAPLPGNPAPRYPDRMREKNVEGEVIVRFVVDTTGYVIPGTIKIIKSTNAAFAGSVRDALPSMRFTPAERQGKKVRQLIQSPFTYSLTR